MASARAPFAWTRDPDTCSQWAVARRIWASPQLSYIPYPRLVSALYNTLWLSRRNACPEVRVRHLLGRGRDRRRDQIHLVACPPGCFQEDQRAMRLQLPPSDSPPSGAPELASADPSLDGHGLYRVGLAYGRLIHRLRWVVIVPWVVAVGVSVPFASQLGSVLTGGGYNFQASESVRVGDILGQKLHVPPATVLVVFQSTATPATDPAYSGEVADFTTRARGFPHVIDATQGPVSADGRTTFVTVNFDSSNEAVQHALDDFRALVPTSGPAKAYITGNPAVYATFTRSTHA